jgi:hypothetical protein
MSEELENKVVGVDKPVKNIRKKQSKKVVQKKTEATKAKLVTAEYKYDANDGEQLITDKPSVPLVKEVKKNNIPLVKKGIKEVKKNVIPMRKSTPIETNGQIYGAYVKELKEFKLVYNSDIIYDSTLSKTNTNLKFESDYFILFGKKYSYNGLRIQKN